MSQEESQDYTEDHGNESEQDPTQQVKAEFNRKIQNLQEANEQLMSQNEQMNQRFEQLMQHITVNGTQTSSNNDEDLEDLKYTDPDAYIEKKLGNVESKLEEKLTKKQQQEQERAQMLQSMTAEYPEISDQNSELYKKASEIYKNYSQEWQSTAEGIKLAILEAASNQGVVPKSKRSQKDASNDDLDEFMGQGGSGMKGSGRGSGKGNKDSDQLNEKTKVIAEFMGIDPKDPKNKERIERIKKYSKRSNWMKPSNGKDV